MKRPRLSPTPSPYSNSPYSQSSPYATSPNGQYLSPHAPLQGVQTPMQTFHQPQPLYHQQPHAMPPQAPPVNTMGPPKLPYSKTTDSSGLDRAEKSTNINDLSDIITAAGIDEREEEDYLSRNYRNQPHNISFGGSFNSQSSSTVSPNGSFQWPQGQHGAFIGTGPLSQAPVTERTVEQKLADTHRVAARAFNDAQQHHLHDPFLTAPLVRSRLQQRAYEAGIGVNVNGVFDKVPETAVNVQQTIATGPDGTSIAVLKADSLLNKNAPMVDILTLISLAAQERVRMVLDDAWALARSRQVGSNGLVPRDWADVAEGVNPKPVTVVPTSLTKSAWEVPDSAVSPMTVPQGIKRKHDPLHDPTTATNIPPLGEPDTGGLPSPPTEAPSPKATIQISNALTSTMRKLAARERRDEEDRLAKRQKRAAVASATATPSVPGTPSDLVIPEKLTKKEQDRIKKLDQSTEHLHRQANQTASMALGGKKKYSWMTGGPSKPAVPARINTSVGGAGSSHGNASGAGGAAPAMDRLLVARDRKFGEFREDGSKGRGIQLRDLVHVLEVDGKERKTLMRTLARLSSKEV